MANIEELFNKLHALINIALDSKILENKGTLTIVLTCLHVLNKKVDLLQKQTMLSNAKLMSLQGDTSKPTHKVSLCTSELELFYFSETEIVLTLNEQLDDALKHK